MTEILVVGYPKSGNTWLSRLLADALDWPVRGIEKARPLSETGEDHREGHVIRQLHLYPGSHGAQHPAVSDRFTLNMDSFNGHHKVVHIIRDPRDVAVAINHYWGIKDLQHTIVDVMASGAWPLWGCGWHQYISAWRDIPQALETRYEWLHTDPQLELQRILDRLELRAVKPLAGVIERQQIDTRREVIRNADDNVVSLPHGKGAQLANLRAGRVGDWQQEFDSDNIAASAELFTDDLITLGYEFGREWHLRQVQTC